MKTKNQTIALVIFVGLATVFVALALAAKMIADPFAQQLMLCLGSAIFGAGLLFFMLRFTEQER